MGVRKDMVEECKRTVKAILWQRRRPGQLRRRDWDSSEVGASPSVCGRLMAAGGPIVGRVAGAGARARVIVLGLRGGGGCERPVFLGFATGEGGLTTDFTMSALVRFLPVCSKYGIIAADKATGAKQ